MRIRRVVTTRAGGRSRPPYDTFNLGDHVGDDPSAVAANRARLASELGLAADHIAWMDQVHGCTVTVVDGPVTTPAPSTDALVTSRPGLAVVALVADCVPVLLGDPVAGVAAAVHAGRVGAGAGVLTAALRTMCEHGADPQRVQALLGPSICGACYEVPAEMAAAVDAQLPGSARTSRTGTPSLDLRAGLWRQLADSGVGKIGVDPRCTVEDEELFSYRRQSTTGRLAAITWLEAE